MKFLFMLFWLFDDGDNCVIDGARFRFGVNLGIGTDAVGCCSVRFLSGRGGDRLKRGHNFGPPLFFFFIIIVVSLLLLLLFCGDKQLRRRKDSDGGERVSTNMAELSRRPDCRGVGDKLSLAGPRKPPHRPFHPLRLRLIGEVATGDGHAGGTGGSWLLLSSLTTFSSLKSSLLLPPLLFEL